MQAIVMQLDHKTTDKDRISIYYTLYDKCGSAKRPQMQTFKPYDCPELHHFVRQKIT